MDPVVTRGAGWGRDAVLSAELDASAVRGEGHRALVQDRVGRSRVSLARHLAPVIDALQEGRVLEESRPAPRPCPT